MRRSTATALAVGAVTTALAVGGAYGPGPRRPGTTLWYATLRKPGFVPPGPVFGVAWSVLGVALMFSGYRLLTAAPTPGRRRALTGWTLNVASIGAWPWLFFGRKQLGASVAMAAGMCVSAVAYVRQAARVDMPATLASLPFVGWLFFALAMDEEVARRNTGSLQGIGDVVRRPLIAATSRLT
jgi:benzodiazapine receptor